VGLKEKMMEEMTSKISPEERKEMMSKMMSAGGGMMGMIATTMGGRKGSEEDFNPMEMCKRMMP
jgi:hypothetical protein